MGVKIGYLTLPVGSLQANCYLCYNQSNRDCFIIDPGAEAQVIIDAVKKEKLNPKGILLTHGHIDHCGAVETLRKELNLLLMMHEDDLDLLNSPMNHELAEMLEISLPDSPDTFLADEYVIEEGDFKIEVIHTPGHSPGSVCFKAGNLLFSGDTLFMGSIGRTDLPGGSSNIIMKSLEKIKKIDDNITVLPGHGPATSIGVEKKSNPFLK